MRIKTKEWLINTKYTNVRRRVKRLTHKQERRILKEQIREEVKK